MVNQEASRDTGSIARLQDKELLEAVLNISEEPCRHLTDREVHQLLVEDVAGYLAFARDYIDAIADGRSQLQLPPKQLFNDADGQGDFRVMPCVVDGPQGLVKSIKLVGTNLRQQQVPGQISVGRAFLLDPLENFVRLSTEACILSSARTGLCAVLGLERLIEQCDSLAIVGAGRVGYYSALYAATALSPARIFLKDRDPLRCQATASLLEQQLHGVELVAQAEAGGIGQADAVILATTSFEPLYAPEDLAAEVVVSLGADTDDQHELKDGWPHAAQIFVDTLDSASYGDLKGWIARGQLRRDQLTDLFALYRGAQPAALRRLYVSTGSALFDNLTLAYLQRKTE